MDNETNYLVDPSDKERAIVKREYIRDAAVSAFKLVKKANYVETQWDCIAIKFDTGCDLINEVVRLRADAYLGESDGYHIFWWD